MNISAERLPHYLGLLIGFITGCVVGGVVTAISLGY